MGSQSAVLTRTIFAAWREDCLAGRWQREVDRMNNQMQQMQAKAAENVRAAAMALLGSQDGVLLRSCFTAWKEDWQEEKNQREADKVRKQMEQQMSEKQAENVRAAALKMMGSQSAVLTRTIFAAWREDCLAGRWQRE